MNIRQQEKNQYLSICKIGRKNFRSLLSDRWELFKANINLSFLMGDLNNFAVTNNSPHRGGPVAPPKLTRI